MTAARLHSQDLVTKSDLEQQPIEQLTGNAIESFDDSGLPLVDRGKDAWAVSRRRLRCRDPNIR